jgi:hypothetical protein
MRRTLVLVTLATAAFLAGCGSGTQAPAAPAPGPAGDNAQPATATDDRPLRDAFAVASKGAPWAAKVKTVKLDGQAVIVVTELVKGEKATAHEVCEAAYKAARTSGVKFVSIGVRTASDSTLSSRNDARGDVACQE